MTDLTSEQMKAEILLHLQSLSEQYVNQQGQIEALRVALFAAFQVVQGNAEFRALVETNLATRLQIMKTGASALPQITGFESTMNELLLGFHFGNDPDKNH